MSEASRIGERGLASLKSLGQVSSRKRDTASSKQDFPIEYLSLVGVKKMTSVT